MGDWRTFRDRVRARHVLVTGVLVIFVLSDVSFTVQPRWRAHEARQTVEQIAHVAAAIDLLDRRMQALEQTDALAFGLLADALHQPLKVTDPVARQQRKALQDQIDEIARNQRLLLERYRAR